MLVEPVVRETPAASSPRWRWPWSASASRAASRFVALLVGPIRRLRAGVERFSAGDLAARVPPTSSDEVGELTRAFNEMGESLQQKERIQRAFGRYVSDYVLNQLLESPEDATLGGAEREVTILFADIRALHAALRGHEGARRRRAPERRLPARLGPHPRSAAARSTSSSATR